jgi:hypothetical protein
LNRPLALLLALLAVHFAYVLRHFEHVLITDEFYYVGKARAIVAHGGLVRADPPAIAVERGETWGTSDWRPQGYPLLLAAVSLGNFDHPAHTLRLRMTILQFLLVAAVLVHAFLLSPRTWHSALIFGLPPWTFAFVNELGPDSVNVAVAWVALLLLWRYVQEPSAGRLLVATFVFSLALFIRPEMIAMPPWCGARWSACRRRITRGPRGSAASSADCTSPTPARSRGRTTGGARRRRRTTSSTR